MTVVSSAPVDHPRVTKESILQYAEAIFPEARMVEQATYQGIFQPAARADIALVRRILTGALSSNRLRNEYRPLVETELKALANAP